MIKRFLNFSMSLALAFLVVACDSDDGGDTSPAPTTDLAAELNKAAGLDQTIDFAVSGTDLTEIEIAITQNGASVLDATDVLTGAEADISFGFKINELGDYQVAVTVTDAAGNASVSESVLTISCMPSADFVSNDLVSVVVQAPGFTTGELGLVGEITGWGEDDVALTRIENTDCFCTTADADALASGGFKFRLDKTWDKVEKDSDCAEISDRSSTAAASDTLVAVVAEWRNSDQFGGGCGN